MLAGHTKDSIKSLPDNLKHRLAKRFQDGTAGWRAHAILMWRLICTVYQIAGSTSEDFEIPTIEMVIPEFKGVVPTPLPETKEIRRLQDIALQRRLAEKFAHKFNRG